MTPIKQLSSPVALHREEAHPARIALQRSDLCWRALPTPLLKMTAINPGTLPDPAAFARRFRFGAATSAYQIEGSVDVDGRGPSMWDRFAHEAGRTRDGSNGDVACDHYQRWRDDLDLMAELGFNAYRFSVAWPRVLPQGRGRVNAAGLDFYERLVDGLLERGIAPYATLYHWDLPLPLADAGGWLSRDTSSAFAEYADQVVRRLGDRVASWATLNEPRCSAYVGHLEGRHAPGLTDLRSALQAAHGLLLGHGLAVAAMRAAQPKAQIGIVLDVKTFTPASDSADDAAAAQRGDGVFNRWFLDPLFRGQYPADIEEAYSAVLPKRRVTDLATIAAPIDTLGINYYTRAVVKADMGKPFPQLSEQRVDGAHYSTMGWEDHPQGLHEMLTRLHRDYGLKDIYIAENGAAEADVMTPDGRVDDPHRVRYLHGHLGAAAQALADGVPLSAYLAWSLMDNFEWGHGYLQRFGLIHVDYASQRRTPKASALAYRDFIARVRAGG